MAKKIFTTETLASADLNAALDWAAYEAHPSKANVRVASTASITLDTSAESGDVIDGVTLATGDRILLKNQTNAYENGIYVVASSGEPTRSTDADTDDKVNSGVECYIEEGTTNAGKKFKLATTGVIILNTTNLSFTEMGGSGGSVPTGTGIPHVVSGVQQAAASLIVNADVASDAAIAEAKLSLASDAVAGTASRRTLGTGAQQAAAGNHSHSNATTSVAGFMTGTDKAKLDNGTASATASTLMLRDANGRAQVAAPVADGDIANKGWVAEQVSSGAADASSTIKGINKLSAEPVGEPIAVGDNDERVTVFGASGSGHHDGLVPTPGSTEGRSRFLKEDGTWSEPPAGTLSVSKFGEAAINDVTDITVKGGNATDDGSGAITLEFTPATIGAAAVTHASTHANGGADEISIDASQVTTGVLNIARLATGTPDGTKFVRDDGTLAVPPGGGGGGGLGVAGAVEAHVTGTQSIANNAATAVSFGATGTDPADYWTSGAPTKIIVPAGYAGRHLCVANVEFAPNSTGVRRAYFLVNGTDIYGVVNYNASSSGDTNTQVSFTLDLADGDEVEVIVQQTSGGALNIQPYSGVSVTRLAMVDEINALQIQGRDVAATAPTDGQVLAWNNTASEYQPVDQSGGGGSVDIRDVWLLS